jgi:hypothetical protein
MVAPSSPARHNHDALDVVVNKCRDSAYLRVSTDLVSVMRMDDATPQHPDTDLQRIS